MSEGTEPGPGFPAQPGAAPDDEPVVVDETPEPEPSKDEKPKAKRAPKAK